MLERLAIFLFGLIILYIVLSLLPHDKDYNPYERDDAR